MTSTPAVQSGVDDAGSAQPSELPDIFLTAIGPRNSRPSRGEPLLVIVQDLTASSNEDILFVEAPPMKYEMKQGE